MTETQKARLEEILDALERLLPAVREATASFKKFRDVAVGSETMRISDLTFAVVIDDETIPLHQPEHSVSREAVQRAMQGAMASRGSEVSKLWVDDIGPLVTEAIAICQRAEEDE
jgi:hypothetical protein